MTPANKKNMDFGFTTTDVFFKHCILSLITQKSIRIHDIRSMDHSPGLLSIEVDFLKFIEALTNGTLIDINYSGTAVKMTPGVLWGGSVHHKVHLDASIAQYLHYVMPIAPFMKNPLSLVMEGITNDELTSVDYLRTVTIPLISRFIGGSDEISLKIQKRGFNPGGGGRVLFTCPVVLSFKSVQLTDDGLVRQIRGIACAARVSPHFAVRMIEAARGILNPHLPDVYIHSDVYKGADSGNSPGYSICLTSVSTTSAINGVHVCGKARCTPEEVGKAAAEDLLKEIGLGGIMDTESQFNALLAMSLTSADVSSCNFGGKVSQETMDLIKSYTGVDFPLARLKDGAYKYTCIGTGFTNFNRIGA